MGLFGPPDVKKLKSRRDVPGLIKALGYGKDPAIRAAAARSLGEIGAADAGNALVATLNDHDGATRQAAAGALGEMGWAGGVRPLMALLAGDDPILRQAAASSLSKIGRPAVEPLAAALKAGAPDVRRAAAGALAEAGIPDDPSTRAWHAVVSRNWDAVAALGPHAVEPLVAALEDKEAKVREVAAQQLGELGDPRALDPLVTVLRDADPGVRGAAALALGRMGDVRAVGPLMAAARSDKPEVRRAAAQAMARLGRPGLEQLTGALKEGNPGLRREAAEALAESGIPEEPSIRAWCAVALRQWEGVWKLGEAAVEPLIAALDDSFPDVPRTAAAILGGLGDARAVEPLVGLLRHTLSEVRKVAAASLGELQDARAARPLLNALVDRDADVRRAASGALQKIGAPAVEALGFALKHGRADARCAAASILGDLGAPAIAPLVEALGDSDGDIREAAAGALAKIGDARSVTPLVRALGDSRPGVRRAASCALGRIGDQAATPALADALRCDDDEDVRLAAAHALTDLGVPEGPATLAWHAVALRQWDRLADLGEAAIPPLIVALSDSSPEVRRAASAALLRVGQPAVSPLMAALESGWKGVPKDVVAVLAALAPSDPVVGAWSAVAERHWDAAAAMGSVAVGPLVAALKDRNWETRQIAAETLAKVGIPDDPATRAWHTVAVGRFGDVERLGSAAVDPLINALADQSWSAKMAARVLVALYREGRIDEQSRRRILAQRPAITQHSDYALDHTHTDKGNPSCHVDWSAHTDTGIGVDFPL